MQDNGWRLGEEGQRWTGLLAFTTMGQAVCLQ